MTTMASYTVLAMVQLILLLASLHYYFFGAELLIRVGLLLSKTQEVTRSGLVPLARGLTRMPGSTRGELSCLLGFLDLSSLAGTQRIMKAKLWECVEVWKALSVMCSIPLVRGGNARETRRDVRWALFHLDGERLRSFRPGCVKGILEEATLMLRGLAAEDVAAQPGRGGGQPLVDVQHIVSVSEKALQDFDPESPGMKQLAQEFMEAVYSSLHLLGEVYVERLDHAHSSTLQLHDLMQSAMQSHLADQLRLLHEGQWEEAVWEAGPAMQKRRQGPAKTKGLDWQGRVPLDWQGRPAPGV